MKNITLLLLLFSINFYSQNDTFNNKILEIGNELKRVENSKKTYEQFIEVTEPGVVKLTITETSLKGKSETNEYIINLGDIDNNTLRHFTNKDLIQVQLIVDRNQKLIKQISNNEKISYVNKVLVLAQNVDNARILVDMFKEVTPISKKITENRLNITSYKDHINWLKDNITDVDLIKSSLSQVIFLLDNKVGNIKMDVVENGGSKSKTESYELNLATVNENSVVFRISGNLFSVELQTKRKLNTIKYFKEFEQQNYVNKMSIACNTVENARDLQKILKQAIILSREEFNKTIPVLDNFNSGIDKLNTYLNTVTIINDTYNQSFTNNPVTVLTRKESDEKTTKEFVYNFNFRDLNKNSVDYDIKGKKILVEFATLSSKKYIKTTIDNELQNYNYKCFVAVNSIDDAIFVKSIILQLIEIANNDYKQEDYQDFSLSFNKLKEYVLSVDLQNKTYEQSIEETNESDNNSIKLSSIEVTDKSSKETIYEFNLSDLNSDNINLETKGKTVYVELNTNYGEKIIKMYEDGEIKNYQNTVLIYGDSVENARMIRDIVILLIKNQS